MAWDDEIPIIVKGLLQDRGADGDYDEDNILEMASFQALFVNQMRTWANPYEITIDENGGTIDPDPTNPEEPFVRDDAFILVVAYRTVVAYLKAELRTMLSGVVKIKDGDSELGFNYNPAAMKLLLESFEKDLDLLLQKYDRGLRFQQYGAIVSPNDFVRTFDPFSCGHSADRRRGWF